VGREYSFMNGAKAEGQLVPNFGGTGGDGGDEPISTLFKPK